MRFRNLGLLGGSIALLAYTTITHPGANTLEEHFIVLLGILAKLALPVLAVLFAHLARKALFDYVDLYTLVRKAKETATGAGLAFLGICIVVFGLLGLFGNQVNAQPVTSYIPAQAYIHIPVLVSETERLWADHPKVKCSQPLSSMNPVLA